MMRRAPKTRVKPTAPSEKYPAATRPLSVVCPTAPGPRAIASAAATTRSATASRIATGVFLNANRSLCPLEPALTTGSLSGVNLFDDLKLAVAIFKDVEAADRRVATGCKFEGPGDTDVVDRLAGPGRLQRLAEVGRPVFGRAGLRHRMDLRLDRGRVGGFGRGRRQNDKRRRIEAVGVKREMLDTARLLPEFIEELIVLGRCVRAAARTAGALERLRGDIARHGREGEGVRNDKLARVEFARAHKRSAELGECVGIVDHHIGVRIVVEDLLGFR